MITFDPDALKARVAELEDAMGAPGFWDDQQKAARISTEHARLYYDQVQVMMQLGLMPEPATASA